MKLLNLLFVSTYSLFTLAHLNAAELRSAQAKKEICEGLEAEFEESGVKAEDCLEGTFTLTEELKDKINGRDRTTLMKVTSKFDNKEFNVTLKKEIFISNAGKVTIGKWLFVQTNTQALGDASIIENSTTSDANVKKLSETQVESIPDAVKFWTYYGEAPDFNLESVVYYKITAPSNPRKIIGYIVEEGSSSEEAGYRALVTAKFNAEGTQIGEISEDTWGLDE